MRSELMTSIIDSSSLMARRYVIAVLSTAIAMWARWLLHPWLGKECPFSLFYLSVLLTAWIAGTGPAILAIVLGTFAAIHFFIPPALNLRVDSVSEFVKLISYVFVNCVATLLFYRLKRQRCLAENRTAENVRLNDSLRLADQRKDEFLALLAHELRNPLAPIQSSLALLEQKQYSPDVVMRVRDLIQRQTTHLVRITDDLLDVSRFCRGMVELQVARLDLREPIDGAVEMVESLFESKSHHFTLLVPDHPVWVDGDRARIMQLTANLLSNAAKYTPEGGRITLNVEQLDDIISVSVTDNGIGFAASEAERILEPFMQMDMSRTREYGGLGVGLTIVDRLISLHGGKLFASSRGPGMGSCFTVTFPTLPEWRTTDNGAENWLQLDASVDATVPVANVVSGVVGRPGRVLIVEDNPDTLGILSELFESEGYQVCQACDGGEAIQEACRQSPDVIILDIGLPGMDGYEIARCLRRKKSTSQVKMIALTGWGGPADRELASQAGFDLHLVKPIVFGELLQCVDDLMNGDSRSDRFVNDQRSSVTAGAAASAFFDPTSRVTRFNCGPRNPSLR